MIKYLTLAACIAFITLAACYGLPKHAALIEAESAFNECLQDLDWQECRAGVYGVQ